MLARFNDHGNKALEAAQREAAMLRRAYIGTEHLLLGILNDPGKASIPALKEGEEEFLKDAHPFERRQCVSVTLETCYDEWCLAQYAKALGKPEAERYARRAENYKNVFDPRTGFMAPRLADGSWVENFDPVRSGGQGGRAYFAECNSWTYTLHVPVMPTPFL